MFNFVISLRRYNIGFNVKSLISTKLPQLLKRVIPIESKFYSGEANTLIIKPGVVEENIKKTNPSNPFESRTNTWKTRRLTDVKPTVFPTTDTRVGIIKQKKTKQESRITDEIRELKEQVRMLTNVIKQQLPNARK